MTKHNETRKDKKLRSAKFRTEGPSDLRFGIRCKQGSRVVRCVTLTTPAGRLFADEARLFLGGPSEPVHKNGLSSPPWSAKSTFLCQGACPRVNRRTDRRCACAAVDPERDRPGSDVGTT